MKTIMVRYKTSEAAGDTNETLVRAVFDELRTRAPGGVLYTSYRLADRATFVHIARFETLEANPLTGLPSFRAFQETLKDRCLEPPVITEMAVVGTYGGVVA